MNRRKRRIIACLLALTLVLSSGGISALAKEDTGSTGGTVSEEPQEKTGSQTSGQDTSVEENGGEATGEQPGSETSSETDQTQGETGTTTNGQPAENTQQTGMQVIGWNWIDEDGVLQNTENVWGLGVPGASEENPLTQDALLEMLPKEVELTLSDGSEKTAALTWDLSAIPAEGIWSGDVTVTATVDGTYSFAEGTAPIEVKVELGGAESYDLSDHTVEGLSPQGTTINLFDYWTGQTGNEVAEDTNDGINQDRLLHFHSGNATQSPGAFNEWTGDGGGPRQGMVKNTLQNGYPELQKNGDLGINHDESLAYLFNGYDSETSGSNRVNGKKAYMDVDGLLQLDDAGYYYYNAAYQVTKQGDGYIADWEKPRADFATANYAEYNGSSNSFVLYEKGAVAKTGKTSPNGTVFDTKTTSDMITPFPLTGGVQFTKIPNGEYYLVETEAPEGYKKSEKAIHVIVDDTGVYADAGVADDGVTVSRGVGSIVKSMVQFATDDMVDATLHDIQATLYTNASTSNPTQDLGWSMSNPEQTTHLQYLNTNKLLEYGPISDKFALTLSTDEGWSKLEIQQCMLHDDGTESPKQDIKGKDLVNLFSGTVIVGVENERIGGLTISKTVETDQGQTAPAGDDFTFTIAANDLAVENKAYDSIHYAADGTETENQINFSAEGTAEVKLKDGESIYIHGLPIDTQFTVTEAENKDYETSVSVNSGQSTDAIAGSVTISNDDNAKVDFTNTYIPKGDFSFTKINQSSDKLSGAVFAIYQLDCNNAGEEGHSHSGELIEVENPNTGALPADETCWKQVGTAVTSGTDGKVEFTDIPIKDNTEYRLVEIKAPAGYTLPKGQWKVTYAEGKFTIEENSAVGNPPAYNKDDETIINYKPGELPFSGNTGILMFLLLGAILMGAGAGGTIWYQHTHRRRRSLR